VWSVESPRDPFENSFGAGPRATPAISGNRIVSYGVTGVLVCRDLKTGKELWKADTLKQFAATNLYFGVSSSPLIDGDHVFVMVGGKQAGLVCFSMADGTVVWKAVDERASYSSPVLAGEGSNRRLIALTQAGVVALDPATGKLDWRYPLVDRLNESSTTPIILKNSLMAASVTYGAVGLKPASGKPEVIWKNGALTCYFSTPVPTASGSEILLVSGRLLPPPSSILRCVDSATGKELWSQPAVGKYHAALMRLSDGRFLMHDDTGNIRLFEATRSEFRELAKSRICGPTWAHPALSQGVLYIRDDKELLALQVRQP
jgi:outer membrane protein assembly factor BamB